MIPKIITKIFKRRPADEYSDRPYIGRKYCGDKLCNFFLFQKTNRGQRLMRCSKCGNFDIEESGK